jgi:hypothetical protein
MQQVARLGGLALKSKPAPAHPCDCCGRLFPNWLSYIGHKGMRQLAINHFGGDVTTAARQLAWNSLAAAERSASWSNGAWLDKYRPITPAGKVARLTEDLGHARLMAAHGATEGVKAAARAAIELIETELKAL